MKVMTNNAQSKKTIVVTTRADGGSHMGEFLDHHTYLWVKNCLSLNIIAY